MYFTSERRRQAGAALCFQNATSRLATTMQQPPHTQLTQIEGRVSLAISAINRSEFKSVRSAAETYDVDEKTIRRRRAGILPRRDCIPNMKKFTELEESVIIQHSLDLDSRGFSPQLSIIRDMAIRLLAVPEAGPVGIHRSSHFFGQYSDL